MPSRKVTLDANGNGWFKIDHPIRTLTIVNATASTVNFVWKLGADSVPLLANTQVELEESEASEVQEIIFLGGAANGSLTVTWA